MTAECVEIKKVGEDEVLILWSDDHRSLYSNRYLRLYCPCAHCVDEWTGKRVVDESLLSNQIRISQWETIGRYALKFYWSDSHSTGIYSYEYLRKLCPCRHCHAVAAASPEPGI